MLELAEAKRFELGSENVTKASPNSPRGTGEREWNSLPPMRRHLVLLSYLSCNLDESPTYAHGTNRRQKVVTLAGHLPVQKGGKNV